MMPQSSRKDRRNRLVPARGFVRVACAVSALALAASDTPARAQAAQDDRVVASFLLALGRAPSAAEAGQWLSAGSSTLADVLTRHRSQLQADASLQQAVAAKADQDAFGRSPGDNRAAPAPAGGLYAELVTRHLDWLAGHPDAYAQVVHRAYQLVLRRDGYDVEIRYWAQRPPLSFALLAGCIDDWARRNQPGLMATTGVPAVSINSRYLTAVRLSPAVAAEVRSVLGLSPAGGRALAAELGRTVMAPGAAAIVSVGGIPFAAAGTAPERNP